MADPAPAIAPIAAFADARSGGDDLFQLRVRILVDLMDRRAGQDVVKLVEQERLPGGVERLVRVGGSLQ
ncbi:MAG: hypothetical protein H0V37_02205 [Chloroflexia bacterium]|nr:hypothetical protein [Chloroflexia bacterium]